MNLKNEWKPLFTITAVFLLVYFLPFESDKFSNALMEAVLLLKWYAREHVILCLVPAFFIAGAISVFISQNSVIKYLGAKANKTLSYGVASVSGSILAVCSCTILPLFAGIYRMGAGLGPAAAFLYAGPAINVLAIILTARILGVELGIARAVGAVLFSIIIGLLMELIFKNDPDNEITPQITEDKPGHSLSQTSVFFAIMILILIFATWSQTQTGNGIWDSVYRLKWYIVGTLWIVFSTVLVFWYKLSKFKTAVAALIPIIMGFVFPDRLLIAFSSGFISMSVLLITSKGESENWFDSSWDLAKQIMPLLFAGVLVSGLLLGRPGNEGIIPSEWISNSVGGNSLTANFFASIVGAFMYFATLTEVPILQGLLGNGMGKGPALALLLAGPALSLPNMLVIRSIMGTKKTVVFVVLVVIMATVSGIIYGMI
ncbi:permease [candidate division KSB1 bacterium]